MLGDIVYAAVFRHQLATDDFTFVLSIVERGITLLSQRLKHKPYCGLCLSNDYGNGILDEYENGGAEKTRPNALELIKPYLPVIIGIAAAVAAVIVLLILLSRRRSSGDGGFRTHGAGKGERIVKESASEETLPDEPKKKEKEKREKNKDKVEFFFSEKKDDE